MEDQPEEPGFLANLVNGVFPVLRQNQFGEAERQNALRVMRNVFKTQPNGFSKHYDRLQFLSSGGFGAVWKARDRATKKQVVVKFLIPVRPKYTERVADFTTEFKVLQKCQGQPNIVHLTAPQWIQLTTKPVTRSESEWTLPNTLSDQVSHTWYGVVMDLYDGDLVSLVNKYGKTEALFNAIFVQCIAGIQQFHKQGYTHQDIKPENFLYKGNLIVLSDVGVAMENKRKRDGSSCGLSGTYLYMSAHQILRKAMDGRGCYDPDGDFESLANSLYRLFIGKLPWEDDLNNNKSLRSTVPARERLYANPPNDPHHPKSILSRIIALGHLSRLHQVPMVTKDEVEIAKSALYEITHKRHHLRKRPVVQKRKTPIKRKRPVRKSPVRKRVVVRKRKSPAKRKSPGKKRRQ
jgi:serine/threonine protein kinase